MDYKLNEAITAFTDAITNKYAEIIRYVRIKEVLESIDAWLKLPYLF